MSFTRKPIESTTISRTQFEGILKSILKDYVRIKNENEQLRRELDSKNESIHLLKAAKQEDTQVRKIVWFFILRHVVN